MRAYLAAALVCSLLVLGIGIWRARRRPRPSDPDDRALDEERAAGEWKHPMTIREVMEAEDGE